MAGRAALPAPSMSTWANFPAESHHLRLLFHWAAPVTQSRGGCPSGRGCRPAREGGLGLFPACGKTRLPVLPLPGAASSVLHPQCLKMSVGVSWGCWKMTTSGRLKTMELYSVAVWRPGVCRHGAVGCAPSEAPGEAHPAVWLLGAQVLLAVAASPCLCLPIPGLLCASFSFSVSCRDPGHWVSGPLWCWGSIPLIHL